ncbi:MAG TPA: choice-of-anchor D domain-containing protein, partial [Kofleriaceae bacterium]|nr:choice-of-anchor D domain-containing protein [Kofleriaceae bacterium]
MSFARVRGYSSVLCLALALSCGDDTNHPAPDAPDVPPLDMAELAVDVTAQPFGTVVVGGQSAAATITVSNTGGVASGVPTVALAGGAAADFEIVTNGCTVALEPAATCAIAVRFAPTSTGTKMASLTAAATPGGSVATALEGVGIAPGALAI